MESTAALVASSDNDENSNTSDDATADAIDSGDYDADHGTSEDKSPLYIFQLSILKQWT
jgi:hypothetical protein